MANRKDVRLSEGQLEIMRVLWPRREATIAEVHAELAATRGVAYTTVATLLKRLENRGVVAARHSGRELVFRPKVTEAEVRRSMVAELVETVFRGDPQALMTHLVKESEVDADDLDSVRRLLERKERDDD